MTPPEPRDPALQRLMARLAAPAQDYLGPRPELTDEVRNALGLNAPERLREAAVLMPVIDRRDGATMLLTRRADSLRTHSGQVSFPGGRRDPDDVDAEHTALREAWEEIGLPKNRVRVIGRLGATPTGTGFLVTPVVGLVDPEWRPRLDRREVAEAFEVPLALLLDAARYRRGSLQRDGLEIPYYALDFEDRIIWGATAGMLRHLIDRLA